MPEEQAEQAVFTVDSEFGRDNGIPVRMHAAKRVRLNR